jgi:general secretion pathway protein A
MISPQDHPGPAFNETNTEHEIMNTHAMEIEAPASAVADPVSSQPAPDLLHLAEKLFAENEARRAAESVASRPVPDSNFVRFYGMRENPFSDAVNPFYFYKTGSHADALTRMILAVEHNTSLGMITGMSGTGKTLVTQLLLQHLDAAKYQPTLVLVSPGMSKSGLLREILSELSIALPDGVLRTHDLLKLLSNYIIDLHQQGRRLVLIIDECHLLNADCLHIVRTISNIEIPECKLVTCLLFGEERFAERIKHPSYDSLRNRMYLRAVLQPMGPAECADYVKFRLMVAGRMADLFDDGALTALHARSGGVCRNLSKLCMLTLLHGAMQGRATIDEDDVAAGAAMM